MKKIPIVLGLLCSTTAPAQIINPTIHLNLETRIDYQQESIDGTSIDDNSGFKGKYLNVKLKGQINDRLSYCVLQRLTKSSYNSSFWDATDYAYLEYRINDCWTVAGGKQFVFIGGFEYDHAPIDIYRGSEFWNNIPCHQMGVSTSCLLNGGHDKLQAQICTNPFNTWEGSNNNTYAYNLMWMGTHGSLSTIYSANMIEYLPEHYISYLALGHCLQLGKAVTLELDYMNRAAAGQTYLFRDASVMVNLGIAITPKLQISAKGTYDVNHNTAADYTVLPGTEIKMAGAGIEYRPLKDQRNELRFHAFGFYQWGKNGNIDGALRDKQTLADVGVTWYMNVLKAGK